jgi:hypothetical protein
VLHQIDRLQNLYNWGLSKKLVTLMFFEKTAMLQKVAPFHEQPLLVYFRQCLLFINIKACGGIFLGSTMRKLRFVAIQEFKLLLDNFGKLCIKEQFKTKPLSALLWNLPDFDLFWGGNQFISQHSTISTYKCLTYFERSDTQRFFYVGGSMFT